MWSPNACSISQTFNGALAGLKRALHDLRKAWFVHYLGSILDSLGSSGIDYVRKGLPRNLAPVRVAFLSDEGNQKLLLGLIDRETKMPDLDKTTIKTMLRNLYDWANNLEFKRESNAVGGKNGQTSSKDKPGNRGDSLGDKYAGPVFKHPPVYRSYATKDAHISRGALILAAAGQIPLPTAIALHRRFKKSIRIR